MNLYLFFVKQIENRLLLCDLFSDRFDILMVFFVRSLFYLSENSLLLCDDFSTS